MGSTAVTAVGRETGIGVVERFLAGAAVHGGGLLLTGPAGTGRTALLDLAATTAAAAGALVVRAVGAEEEADLPFAGLSQLLAPLGGALERLDPGHRAVLLAVLGADHGHDGDERPADGNAVAAALAAALEAASDDRPVVVAVDDLPMIDASSAACLRSLIGPGPGRRIGLIATAETGAGHGWLPECRLAPRADDAATARSAYLAAAVGGDLGAAPALPGPAGGRSLWAATARAHLLLHGDGDLDAAHRLLVDAMGDGADPDVEPGELTAALDTLHTVCRFADRPALWSPYHALAERHAARVPAVAGPGAGAPPGEQPDPVDVVRAGWSLLDVDDVQRRAVDLHGVLDDGLRGRASGSAMSAAVLLALDAFAAGRWDDTGRLARQGQALCAAHAHETLAVLAAAGPALVAACRGDEVACHEHTSRMIGWAAPRGARLVHHYAAHARVLAALGRGDAESAYHLACGITQPGAVEPGGTARRLVMDLVEAAVRTQRHDAAVAHVRAARRAGFADVSARSALLIEGATALTEQGERARSRYEQALAAPGIERFPFDVARVRLAYGEHLRRSRSALAARQQLVAALATFRRLGADPWTARTESELRAAGHRVLRARGTTPTALSHQEQTVARLAATGATNRQIGERLGLSPRTVGSHLSRVFHKLGITSRAALGEALRADDPA